ncbi:MAG: pirin family protein [Chitinophagaceae bacterium]
MNIRSIEHIFPAPAPHMVGDGFRVHNFFPSGPIRNQHRMSPFFMLDYGSKIDFPPTDTPRGVGVHPHRGFETVTIAYHGRIAHHDSAGNHGIIGQGDVQWMTAASGVLHKEYHDPEYAKKGGAFQMVQLWVNLPAAFKMSPPKYQEILNANMGVYQLEAGMVEIIAGEYKGVKGPASTFTPMYLMNVKLTKGGSTTLTFPSHYNTALLAIEGSVFVNKQPVKQDEFVLMANDGESFEIEATEESILLVLSGEPINEPIAAYGPFLMNNREEIEQAIRDFNMGKFGTLEDN